MIIESTYGDREREPVPTDYEARIAEIIDETLAKGGCCLGFLVYNFHPARVFMGDTGSLFLGGLAVGMAFMAKNPLIILVAGFMYVLEAISDIIQVVYFKLTHGKRFFRMAPIHHHFEKCGWGEIKIVAVFSAVTLLLCAAALLFDTVPSLPR